MRTSLAKRTFLSSSFHSMMCAILLSTVCLAHNNPHQDSLATNPEGKVRDCRIVATQDGLVSTLIIVSATCTTMTIDYSIHYSPTKGVLPLLQQIEPVFFCFWDENRNQINAHNNNRINPEELPIPINIPRLFRVQRQGKVRLRITVPVPPTAEHFRVRFSGSGPETSTIAIDEYRSGY